MSTYLDWVLEHTPTRWWHDSADPAELALGPAAFITFGATQRTLSQFTEVGWKELENVH